MNNQELTLKEWIIDEAHDDHMGLIDKHGDKLVISIHDGCEQAFPQSRNNYRNVYHWVILEDGSAVGWNESPRSGWSFPRTGRKTVKKHGYI